MSSTISKALLALFVTQAVALNVPRAQTTQCNADDKLRALKRCGPPATTFCLTDRAAISSDAFPSCVTRFPGTALVSACSCFLKENSITPTGATATATNTVTAPPTATSTATATQTLGTSTITAITDLATPDCTPTNWIQRGDFENDAQVNGRYQFDFPWVPYTYSNFLGVYFVKNTVQPEGYGNSPTWVESIDDTSGFSFKFRGGSFGQSVRICKATAVQQYKFSFYAKSVYRNGDPPPNPAPGDDLFALLEPKLVYGGQNGYPPYSQTYIPRKELINPIGFQLYEGVIELVGPYQGIFTADFLFRISPFDYGIQKIIVDNIVVTPL